MPLVAIAGDKFARGVGGASVSRMPPPAVYEQLELIDALHRVWKTDAHVVSYLLPPDHELVVRGRQPRLTKKSPPEVLADASFTTIFVDADNPGHAPWTEAERAKAISKYHRASLPFGVYHTTGGARFVLPLATPVSVLVAEPLIRRVLSTLDGDGFGVDYSGKDWTRHMRMPNVLRAGRPFATPYMDLSRMVPITVEPLDVPVRQRATRTPRALPPIPFTPSLADHWQQRARTIGDAVGRTVTADYHVMYLAIAGALLQRQVPPEHVPELVRLIAVAAASTKPEHHEKSAQDTVVQYLAGNRISGMSHLAQRHPALADAVHDALADAHDIHLRAISDGPTPAPAPLAVTIAALERTIHDAPDGLTVIVAECGLGKSQAAQRVAAARATSRPPSARAPAQTKTAIACDKNELAVQISTDLAVLGVSVRRVFGPLSVLHPSTREPLCKLHTNALPLVEGGQSVRWEFCLGRGRYKCPHYDGCPAKDGEQLYGPATDDSAPRVTVGTHALLRELDAAAGSTGLLVIDEPPPLLETFVVLPDDVALALNNVSSFQRDFAAAMTPVLLAVRDWTDPEITFDDLTDTFERPPTVGADQRPILRPPLRADTARACRADIMLARIVGKASSVLRALFRAMTDPDATVRLEDEPPRIVVTAPRPDLSAALRREGSVIAMDANADLHLPGFAKVVGYEPPVHRFLAEDGAPIERTILRCGSATRRSWLSHGRLVLDTGLFAALRGIASWADECAVTLGRPPKLGIITIRLVEIAIRYAQGEDVLADWVKSKQSSSTLTEAASTIASIFSSLPPISLAHYGATRGLNRLASVDCLATVGDPWPNLGTVQAEATYLALDWDARAEQQAMAELEQAHGRLRTVHRSVPGFALHVGRVLPGGSGWKASAVRSASLQGGRPPAGAPMPAPELADVVAALGGVRATARAVGCSHSSIARYQAGQGVPPGVASRLRHLALEASHGKTAE